MPRQVRIEFPGALYHVMCRGDRREPIVADDTDRRVFFATLGQAAARAGWRLHAYVLMDNHYHLLLETPTPNLVRGMTWFQTTYTVRFNARHRPARNLFGGRYKAVLVEDGPNCYFQTLIDYIHLNPVRAGLVATRKDKLPDVAGYPWSSLPEYRGSPSKRPAHLETARGFRSVELKDGPVGRRRFVERLALRAQRERAGECGLAEIDGQGLQSTLRRGWCYGTDAFNFRKQMLEFADVLLRERSSKRSPGRNYRGEDVRDHGQRQAEQILRAGLSALGLAERDLAEMKKSADQKALIALKIRTETTVPLAWVAEKLSMGTPANAARASNAAARRLSRDRGLKRMLKLMNAEISS